jgi:hypothetical protein
VPSSHRPLLLALAVTCAAHALIEPWGEFPLNDDFTFARVAKTFAQTGKLRVDLPSAPSIVGQSLTVYPFVAAFGFSHLLLRLLTMGLGLIGLVAIDRLLFRAGTAAGPRLAALLLVALNPLYLYLSTTFMTELWGYVPAFLGAWLWFVARNRADQRHPPGPLVSAIPAISVALLIGSTFWTRQYCALAFPALVGGTVLRCLHTAERPRLARSAGILVAATLLFALTVGAYFPWARWTGNLRPEFAQGLSQLRAIDPRAIFVGSTNFLAYMTAFLLPGLLLFRIERGRATAIAGALLIGTGVAGWSALQTLATSDFAMGATLHRIFPFGGNVLYSAGVGPVTLSDVYLFGLSRPQWSPAAGKALQLVLLIGAAAWAPAVLAARNVPRATLRFELAAFAFLFGAVSLLLPLQTYKLGIFDRYFIPCVLSLAVGLALLLQDQPIRRARWVGFAALLVPLACFGIGGLHDQFRWNEARWQLVQRAIAAGAPATSIDGGYEVNGWLNLDAYNAKQTPTGCLGECGCGRGWWCLDASYVIAMNELAGYEVIDRIQPDYWLTRGPAMLLLRRQPQDLLRRYVSDLGHWASLEISTHAVREEASWRVMRDPSVGGHPIFECAYERTGELTFLSRDPLCQGQHLVRPAGHLFDRPLAGTAALHRCRVTANSDRFVSADPGCEGQSFEDLLGYAPR